MRVHFICNGNAYRSPMAEAYFRSLNTGIDVTSSGTRADIHRESNRALYIDFMPEFLRQHNLPVVHEPIQLTQEMLDAGDVLVAINQIVQDNMRAKFTVPEDIRVWDISDLDEQKQTGEEPLDRKAHAQLIFQQIRANVDELIAELL